MSSCRNARQYVSRLDNACHSAAMPACKLSIVSFTERRSVMVVLVEVHALPSFLLTALP